MRLTIFKKRELLRRMSKAEKRFAYKKAPKPLEIEYQCHHAEELCPCSCENHEAESVLEYWARPSSCTCKQFHKPPKTACGCVSEEEVRVIDGFPDFKIVKQERYDKEDVLRKVPGMYRFELPDEGKIYRIKNLIFISTAEGEDIIAEIPYKFILTRFGVNP